ncbi:LOW QUALITY PROTEIN: hypothetical protein YC2023_052436 [Brassica napus]
MAGWQWNIQLILGRRVKTNNISCLQGDNFMYKLTECTVLGIPTRILLRCIPYTFSERYRLRPRRKNENSRF